MGSYEHEEDALAGLMTDTGFGAELVRAYATWLEERLYCIRDWVRLGDRTRLIAEARYIAIATTGIWANRVGRLAMQLQVAATGGSLRQQARICGSLWSQIDLLNDTADIIDGCQLARVRAR